MGVILDAQDCEFVDSKPECMEWMLGDVKTQPGSWKYHLIGIA